MGDTLCRAEAAGLSYAIARDVSDAELYARLYPGNTGSSRRRVEPDYEFLHRELRRADADVTRQQHRAGQKAFVDFAGKTQPLVDPHTGEVFQAPVFCACLGASNNLKDAVRLARFYEPDINPSYADLARHYDLVVLPARVRKSRDKAKVESAVQQVERQVMAPLRNRTFFSLAEANAAFAEQLKVLNARPFQKMSGSRKSLFEELDRPALSPLPAQPYEFAAWKRARVNIDYHVQVDHAFYSVPYQLARREVEVRLSQGVVEIFPGGKRVAGHVRTYVRGRFVTDPAHMPASHRRHLEWTPSRLISWGETVGPNTAALITGILERRPHPEQGYRSCLGLMRLAQEYTPEGPGSRFGPGRLGRRLLLPQCEEHLEPRP